MKPLLMFISSATLISNLFFFISFSFILFHGATISAQGDITNIGAIIDINSRIGQEEKVSMEVAIQTFNSSSSYRHKLVLHVRDSSGDPLQASIAANELINKTQVRAIIGMETWKEASLVSEVANRAQVPILSFASPSTTSLTSMRWPFLVRMASHDSLQIQCLASIISCYGWRKVIAIYEEDSYYTDSGILGLLSDALQPVGSEIEHILAFPPFLTLSNPKSFIQEELFKLNRKQSRVFIIVQSSLELATHVLTEANHNGLMGRDSVWIAAESVTNLIHTLNSSVISSMQGLIGIKAYFSDTSKSFLDFSTKFRTNFRSSYPEIDKIEPGIYALRAYDALSTVALALEKSTNSSTTSPTPLLGSIQSTKFNGLSSKIEYENEVLSQKPMYEIINVVGKSYIVLKLWSPDYKFSDKTCTRERNTSGGGVGIGVVYWPGGLDRTPLGWAMPNNANPMVIGVPGRTQFEKFVKVTEGEEPTGYCIDLFNSAVKLLNYDLPHTFVSYEGNQLQGLYSDMMVQLYRKEFDAVVGDFTILANRSNHVEFTQPYAETGLTMVVPVKQQERDWLFTKPFTKTMWLAVCVISAYTMFVIWFLEHKSNPEFGGPGKNQLSTAMWFTFSTIFFAQKETPRTNYTRVVVAAWLLVVFVVTSSYNASLTSMLTVQRLEPTVTDIETLKKSNSVVGCDGDSFVTDYLERVLKFHPTNIKNVKEEIDYLEEFRTGKIKAAFLEVPYKKVFLNRYCKDYQVAGPTYRFGGLAFAFQKGSPIARDFSKAFLKLSEDGTLDELDRYWFPQSPECSNSDDVNMQSLSLKNFWTLFLITGLTSTIMLILYIVHLYMKLRRHPVGPIGTMHAGNSFWSRIKRLGTYLISAQSKNDEILVDSNGEYICEYTSARHQQLTAVSEIEMPHQNIGNSTTQTRALRIANSFPALDRPVHEFMDEESKWQHVPNST